MNRSNIVFIPRVNKTIISRQTRGSKKGRGIGNVILDGGLGGQSSYFSVDDYISTTKASPIIATSGRGIKGLDSIRNNLENLIIKPSVKKPKNIKFSI